MADKRRASAVRGLLGMGYESSDGRATLAGTFQPSKFLKTLLLQSTAAALLERDHERDRRRFVAIMHEIRVEAKKRYGAELLVLYHAAYDFLSRVPVSDGRLLRTLLCEAGVSFVDVADRVPINAQTLGYLHIPGDGHPSSELNAQAARLTAGYFGRKTQPDPCPISSVAR